MACLISDPMMHNHPVDDDALRSESRRWGLRDVPWRWSDLVVGFAPMILTLAVIRLARTSSLGLTFRNLWAPLTLVAMVWMFAYPLWTARRRGGTMVGPALRTVLLEGLYAVLAAPVVLTSVTVLLHLASMFGGNATPRSSLEPLASSSRRLDWLALAVLAVAVAPVAEEMFFRGMLYNALRRRLGPISAVPIQAVVFAFAHPFGVQERVAVGLIGVFLASLYEWRRTLIAPIALHFWMNALAVGMMFLVVAADAKAPMMGVGLDQHEGGCLVTFVNPGGAAEEAGIRVGDVIQAAGEYAVVAPGDLVTVLRAKHVGDTIPVFYRRDGETYQIDVKLKARPR